MKNSPLHNLILGDEFFAVSKFQNYILFCLSLIGLLVHRIYLIDVLG
jgi:hypothetical protein